MLLNGMLWLSWLIFFRFADNLLWWWKFGFKKFLGAKFLVDDFPRKCWHKTWCCLMVWHSLDEILMNCNLDIHFRQEKYSCLSIYWKSWGHSCLGRPVDGWLVYVFLFERVKSMRTLMKMFAWRKSESEISAPKSLWNVKRCLTICWCDFH